VSSYVSLTNLGGGVDAIDACFIRSDSARNPTRPVPDVFSTVATRIPIKLLPFGVDVDSALDRCAGAPEAATCKRLVGINGLKLHAAIRSDARFIGLVRRMHRVNVVEHPVRCAGGQHPAAMLAENEGRPTIADNTKIPKNAFLIKETSMNCLSKNLVATFQCKVLRTRIKRVWISMAIRRGIQAREALPSPFVASLLNTNGRGVCVSDASRLQAQAERATSSDLTGCGTVWVVFGSTTHIGLIISSSSCSMMWQCQA